VSVAQHDTTRELTGHDRASMLAQRSRLLEQLEQDLRDNSYEETPIGQLVARYLAELRFDNYRPGTIQNREYILSKLALKYAHRELADLTYDDLRAFLNNWAGAAANTRSVYVSAVKTFVGWAHERDLTPTDPGRKLRGPRAKDTTRRAHSADTFRKLVWAQQTNRERVGLLLLYWCALRRNELRLIQFEHIDLADRVLAIVGAKGGETQAQNIPEQLAIPLERYIQDRMPKGDEYVLHPQKLGQYGSYPAYSTREVVWEDKFRPLSMSGIDKWWQRCCANAGLALFPMHELRHTAGTDFHRTSHDLYATQQFMRHKSPATTARTYLHLDVQREVADVQRRMTDPMESE
jgi:integrase